MEMPEGWKRLRDYASDHEIHNGDMGGCWIECEGYAEALDLMKEMVEALNTIRVSAEHGLTGLKGYHLCAEKVLDKFKEWK